jgi:hypothetical protein
MLNEPTRDKLRALRLNAMASAWSEQHQQSQFAELGFDERFGLLVEAQWLYRENQRLTRLLKDAKLKMSQATVEDIDFPARRELDRAVVRQLATCRWVQEHHNLLISGATGTGKTFVSPARLLSWPAATATASSIAGPHACSTSSLSLMPTAPTHACSGGWPASTSSLSMTSDWPRSTSSSAATCTKSSTIATAYAPPSSPASCSPSSGTPTSAIPRWPTPSVIASFTMPTSLC